MKVYLYHAIDYAGQTSKGRITSPSPEAASGDLGLRGLYVVSLLEGSPGRARVRRALTALRIGRTDLLEFVQGFSVLLSAGMPLLNCLDDVISSTPNRALVSVLRELRQRVEGGEALSAALAAHGDLFPGVLRSLVAVGEETGTLALTMKEAAEHLMRMQKLKDVVLKALMYPVLALGATLGALVFWLAFVIPALAGSLKSLGVQLPALTLFLIGISAFFLAHWGLCLVVPGALALALALSCRNPRVRYLRDWLLIKTPGVKGILLNKLMVTFSEQFGMLVRGGIGIEKLFDLILPAVGNEYFGAHLRLARENVLNGGRISDSLAREGILPPLAISKISIGESTGTLDSQLRYLATWYARKLDDCIDNLGRLVEPLVMVVIGGLFALIVLGLLLPIYDLVSKLGKT